MLIEFFLLYVIFFFFFCNDTATTEIYTYWHTLSLHDALPILLDPRRIAILGTNLVRVLRDHAQAEVLQRRQDIRQWQRRAATIELECSRLRAFAAVALHDEAWQYGSGGG